MGLTEKITTADPGEFALRVWVPDEKIIGPHLPTTGVTVYREFKMHPTPNRAEGYGDYVYTYADGERFDQETGQRFVGFYFGKPKTDEEKRTAFHSFIERMGNHRWPDILVALAVTADYTFPRATTVVRDNSQGVVTAPRYRIAEALVPEMNEGTRFMVQEFQAPTFYAIPRYRLPCATSVRLTLPDGSTYNHPECWHDDIELEAVATADMTLIAGASSATTGTIGSQKFPASPFARWRPYWFSDEQQLRNGVVYRRRVRVIPPRVPATMFRAA